MKGEIDLESDTLIWILMDTGFTFNQASHHVYSDVSGSELATGAGYTQKTKEAEGVSLVRNDTLFKPVITWSNAAWTASGSAIGPSPGAFLLDDTHADDPLLFYVDFGGEGSEPDGGVFTIANPTAEIVTYY